MSFQKPFTVVSVLLLYCLASGQNFCGKFDFNQTYLTGFNVCYGKSMFMIKDYFTQPQIRPYRPTSRYFLGTNSDSYYCMASINRFSINANSHIEAAIYLKSNWNSFVEITLLDADRNMPVHVWQIPVNGNWYLLQEEIRTPINNAIVSVGVCHISLIECKN